MKDLNPELNQQLKAFDKYLTMNEKSAGTRTVYLDSVNCFYNSFDEITKENLLAFKEQLMTTLSPSTARLRVIALNQFCRFLGKDDCTINAVRIYNKTTSLENVPTIEEYYYFINELKRDGHIKMYWMIKFIAATGVRASELAALEKSCLTTGSFTMLTKGKIRKILIPQRLVEESRAYFDTIDSKYLFPNHSGEKMQPKSIPKLMKRYGIKYGLREEILHPHAFRHFFAIHFLENSKDLTLLSNLLGHESVRTTAIYTMLSSDRQREELNKAVRW